MEISSRQLAITAFKEDECFSIHNEPLAKKKKISNKIICQKRTLISGGKCMSIIFFLEPQIFIH
jgi:hypothetical protein